MADTNTISIIMKASRSLWWLLQAKWVAQVLSGRARLPSRDAMEADIQEFYNLLQEAGMPVRYTHCQVRPDNAVLLTPYECHPLSCTTHRKHTLHCSCTADNARVSLHETTSVRSASTVTGHRLCVLVQADWMPVDQWAYNAFLASACSLPSSHGAEEWRVRLHQIASAKVAPLGKHELIVHLVCPFVLVMDSLQHAFANFARHARYHRPLCTQRKPVNRRDFPDAAVGGFPELPGRVNARRGGCLCRSL